jgi:hypothetical protein
VYCCIYLVVVKPVNKGDNFRMLMTRAEFRVELELAANSTWT